MAAIKEFSHKELDLSPSKFQKLVDFYHTNIASDHDAFNTEMEEANTARFEAGTEILKGQWLDGTDERTAAALAHLQKYAEFEVKGKDGEMVNPCLGQKTIRHLKPDIAGTNKKNFRGHTSILFSAFIFVSEKFGLTVAHKYSSRDYPLSGVNLSVPPNGRL